MGRQQDAVDVDTPEPQAVLTPITEAAIFLVLTVARPVSEQIRELLADVSALKRSVGFRVPEGELTCVVGLGSRLWDDLIGEPRPALLAYKDVTSSTNQRTMIAAFIPFCGVVNSAPLMLADGVPFPRQCCLLGNLNSMAYDFIARQKVGSVHLNFFIVE